MSHQIETLQMKLDEARIAQDGALLELRILKSRSSSDSHMLAEAFVRDFREDSRKRRNDVSDRSSLQEYLEWLGNASSMWSHQLCQYLEGDVRYLAIGEIQLIRAAGSASAIQQLVNLLSSQEYPVLQLRMAC